MLLKAYLQTLTGLKELIKQPESNAPIAILSVPMIHDNCKLRGVSTREKFALLRLP